MGELQRRPSIWTTAPKISRLLCSECELGGVRSAVAESTTLMSFDTTREVMSGAPFGGTAFGTDHLVLGPVAGCRKTSRPAVTGSKVLQVPPNVRRLEKPDCPEVPYGAYPTTASLDGRGSASGQSPAPPGGVPCRRAAKRGHPGSGRRSAGKVACVESPLEPGDREGVGVRVRAGVFGG
jgi:hypothetical protein